MLTLPLPTDDEVRATIERGAAGPLDMLLYGAPIDPKDNEVFRANLAAVVQEALDLDDASRDMLDNAREQLKQKGEHGLN